MMESLAPAATKKISMKSNSAEETGVSNSEPHKKIVKLTEFTENSGLSENKMDPMEYFARFLDIPEMILQHFSGKELLRLTEVSPTYYNCIASSKTIMKKIKVILNEYYRLYPEDYNLLKNSSRQYQNIEVLNHSVTIAPLLLKIFLEKSHDWKNVKVIDTGFGSEQDLWKFLSSIELTVESLCLDGVAVRRDAPKLILEALTFPKLKHFEIKYKNYGPPDTNKSAMKMLLSFQKLTSLKLYSQNINQMFKDESWKRFEFKLKSFAMFSSHHTNFLSSADHVNFQNFLKSQSDQLEKLTIEIDCDSEAFNFIMNMPKLKSLSLKKYPPDLYHKESLTITDLTISGPNMPAKAFKDLLKCMPNVKRLSISFFYQKHVHVLLRSNMKLDELRVNRTSGKLGYELTEISKKVIIAGMEWEAISSI